MDTLSQVLAQDLLDQDLCVLQMSGMIFEIPARSCLPKASSKKAQIRP